MALTPLTRRGNSSGTPRSTGSLSQRVRESSVPFLNLVNTTLGAGILSLPYAFAQGGRVSMTIFVLIIAAVSLFSSLVLVRAAALCRAHHQGAVARFTSGPLFEIATNVTLVFFTLGACVGYLLVIGDYFPLVLAATTSACDAGSAVQWLCAREASIVAVGTLFVLPLALQPSLTILAKTSFLGLASVIFTTFVVAFELLANGPAAQGTAEGATFATAAVVTEATPHDLIEFGSLQDVLSTAGIVVFGFVVQIQVVNIFYEVPDPLRIEGASSSIGHEEENAGLISGGQSSAHSAEPPPGSGLEDAGEEGREQQHKKGQVKEDGDEWQQTSASSGTAGQRGYVRISAADDDEGDLDHLEAPPSQSGKTDADVENTEKTVYRLEAETTTRSSVPSIGNLLSSSDKRRLAVFDRALVAQALTVSVLYVVMGLCGYMMFGAGVDSNVLVSFSSQRVSNALSEENPEETGGGSTSRAGLLVTGAELAITIVATVSYPMLHFTGRLVLYDFLGGSCLSRCCCCRDVSGHPNSQLGEKAVGMSNTWRRGLTSSFYLVSLGAAMLVRSLGDLWTVFGSTCGFMVMFAIPASGMISRKSRGVYGGSPAWECVTCCAGWVLLLSGFGICAVSIVALVL